MIKEAICTGETVLAAREAACEELGIETHEGDFEVLQRPEKKRFGLFGGCLAKVRVFIKVRPIDVTIKYLRAVLDLMGLEDMKITENEKPDGVDIVLEGENAGALIGKRGETLDALQYLVSLTANRIEEEYFKVTINIGNYREKREKALEILGKKLASKAIKTGIKTHLEPMNPFERRIIHTAVQGMNGAISWSEGENLARHVVIGPDPNARRNFRPNNKYKNTNNKSGKRPTRQFNKNNNTRFSKDNEKSAGRKPINEAGNLGLYEKIK